MKKITVYSRTSCSPCKTLKYFLEKKGLEFTERNVDESDEAQAEAYAYSGMSTVPVTVITSPDGSRRVLSGLRLAQLSEALQD